MKINTKWIGYGGIKCDCCTWFKSKKQTRIRVNRELRRKSKQSLNQLTKEITQ